MKLERHVGGLGHARKVQYLQARGWRELEKGWTCARHSDLPLRLDKALHHQLTEDLVVGLSAWGWTVAGYSTLGYVKLKDPVDESLCSLPAALRRQSRRMGRKTGELGYSLFLGAMLPSQS